jgi:hypothetical protein
MGIMRRGARIVRAAHQEDERRKTRRREKAGYVGERGGYALQ